MEDRVNKARRYATVKHAGQTRDGSDEPYVRHVERVFELLVDVGVTDQDVLCAALLHDTVEDTSATHEDILAEFGPTVAELVRQLTLPKELRSHDKRRMEYQAMPRMDERAVLVKLADKLDNLASLPGSGWTKPEQREYYEHVSVLTNSAALTFVCVGGAQLNRLVLFADAALKSAHASLFF